MRTVEDELSASVRTRMTSTADLRTPVSRADPEPLSAEDQRQQATEFIRILRSFGITLESDGTTLTARAPKGTLNPELRATIADMKPALMMLVKPKPKPENLGEGTYWYRLQRARFVMLFGEQAADEIYRNRDSFAKYWNSLPVRTDPW